MNAHWSYLKYVVRHKWFVLLAGLKLGVPIWQLLIHDLSKFSPGEWFPYVANFYGGPHRPWAELTGYEKNHFFDAAYRLSKEGVQEAFDRAWLHHQNVNPHHWQYWVLLKDDGSTVALAMPYRYMREMVADWMGAGRAQGKSASRGELVETRLWYLKNRERMVLHDHTRGQVEAALGVER